MSEEPHRVRTRHAELTLEEIAGLLPSTGEVMRSVGHCFGMAWHAAQAGGWELAMYYVRRTRGLLRGLAVTRPKYAEQLREFDTAFLDRAYRELLARDLAGFQARYEEAVTQANRYHVDTGHPYISWRRPPEPPDLGLELKAEA